LSDAIRAICVRPAYKHILYNGKCHAIQVGDGVAVLVEGFHVGGHVVGGHHTLKRVVEFNGFN
jgi:hypothetical protein